MGSVSNKWKANNEILIYYTAGFILLVLCFLRDNIIAGYISMLVFFLFFISFAFKHKQLIIKHLAIFFGLLYYAIGNIICDFTKIYLVELGVLSRYVGSFSLLAFLFWIEIVSLSYIDKAVSKIIYKRDMFVSYKINNLSLNKLLMKCSSYLIFVLGFALFLTVVSRPSFLMNVNRFAYAKKYLPPYIDKMKSIPILFVPFVYNIIIVKKSVALRTGMRKLLLIYLPFILFAFWIGNKFGIFLQLLLALLIPCVYRLDFDKIDSRKYFKSAFKMSLVFLAIFFGYWFLRGNSFSEILIKIAIRTSQQGELWWRVVEAGDWTGKHFNEFGDEVSSILTSIITRGDVKEYGVYRLMKLYGNELYLQHYFDIDMRLSAQGFELCFYYLGLSAFIIFPLLSNFIYSLITNLYIKSVNSGSFSAIYYLRAMFLFQSAICQGDWYRFTSILDLLLMVLCIFDVILRNTQGRIKKLYQY